jgi:hypothetical protein
MVRMDVGQHHALAVQADGIDDPMHAGNSNCDGSLVVDIGRDRPEAPPAGIEALRPPIWMTGRDPHGDTAFPQLSYDPTTEKSCSAKDRNGVLTHIGSSIWIID